MLNTKDSATINTYDVNTNNSEKTNFNPHLEAIFNTKQVKTYESEAKQIKLGSRCLLSDGFRKGEIAFNGLIPELGAGYFIGIKLDEPMGNCNGNIMNKTYFECGNKCGTFERPDKITIGDYPPDEEEF